MSLSLLSPSELVEVAQPNLEKLEAGKVWVRKR
jgi:hypothetical protein